MVDGPFDQLTALQSDTDDLITQLAAQAAAQRSAAAAPTESLSLGSALGGIFLSSLFPLIGAQITDDPDIGLAAGLSGAAKAGEAIFTAQAEEQERARTQAAAQAKLLDAQRVQQQKILADLQKTGIQQEFTRERDEEQFRRSIQKEQLLAPLRLRVARAGRPAFNVQLPTELEKTIVNTTGVVASGRNLIRELKAFPAEDLQSRIGFQFKRGFTATDLGKTFARIKSYAADVTKLKQGSRPSDFDFQIFLDMVQGDFTANGFDVIDLLERSVNDIEVQNAAKLSTFERLRASQQAGIPPSQFLRGPTQEPAELEKLIENSVVIDANMVNPKQEVQKYRDGAIFVITNKNGKSGVFQRDSSEPDGVKLLVGGQ